MHGTTMRMLLRVPTVVDGGASTTLGLAIEDTPLSASDHPTKDWADSVDFGAKGDGTTDDATAIQAALDSGKSVVVFPKAQYKSSKALTIPATVNRIDGMWSDLHNAAFVIASAATAHSCSVKFRAMGN